MAMETQTAFDASSMLGELGPDPTLPDVTLSSSQFFERSEPVQIQIQILLSAPAVPMIYPENCLPVVSGGIRRINRFRAAAWTLRYHQTNRGMSISGWMMC